MIALVTGGGGFLGSAIVRRLIEQGDRVKNFSRRKHLILKRLDVEQYCGDLANIELLAKAAKGCDCIFHVAAKPGIWGPYHEYYKTNVKGTQNVIDVCRQYNIKKLIFTSSPSVVFSGSDQEGVDESEPYPKKYLCYYSKTKAIAEKLVLEANCKDLSTISLRPHLIWGPGDNHLVPRLLSRAKCGKLRKIGDDSKLVDSVYIDNAAEAHLLAADCLAHDLRVAGKAYFISQGEPTPMGDLIDNILAAGDLPPITSHISPFTAYIVGCVLEVVYTMLGRTEEPRMTRFLASQLSTSHWFDISAAKRDLGYKPSVSMKEGMKRLAESLQKKQVLNVKR